VCLNKKEVILKRYKFLLVTLLLIFAANAQIFAQDTTEVVTNTTYDYGTTRMGYVDCYVHNTDTLTLAEFNYEDCVFTSGVGFKLFQSDTSKPKITLQRWHSGFANEWSLAKTLYTADSIETQGTFSDTLKTGKNKYVIIGAANNSGDTRVRLRYEYLKQ